MYDFILLLITKEFIHPKMIVIIFPEIDETTRVPSEHITYVRLMYIQFKLCPRKR